MPILRVGSAEIPYQLRRSATATERKIIVTPGSVEVVALAIDDADAVAGFLRRKRQWVFNTVRDMERVTANRHGVPRLMTGSKVLFRGRKMSLTVRRTDAERAEVVFRKGVIVDLPNWVGEDADRVIVITAAEVAAVKFQDAMKARLDDINAVTDAACLAVHEAALASKMTIEEGVARGSAQLQETLKNHS